MIAPIILVADDGISWFGSKAAVEITVESPDVNSGVYSAYDSTGRRLKLTCAPTEKSWFGMVSVDGVTLDETDISDRLYLKSTIDAYLTERYRIDSSNLDSLSASINVLVELQAEG